jgi:hypothetical protein
MSEGMFGSREATAQGSADAKTVASETGSNDSGVPAPRQFDEAAVQKLIQERLGKQAKKYAAERAELEDRLAAYEGTPTVDDDEKKPQTPKSTPADAEIRRKLSKTERDYKALQERLEKHRQGTLKAAVQSKLAEKDCIDPEIVYGDLVSKGLVKMDEDDNVVVDPMYGDLDKLVDDYLSRREYLKRSKTTGGLGSKAPGISAVAQSEKERIIQQVRSVAMPGNKLFGPR